MDCSLIRDELVPFHFGQCEGALRAGVETHLLACVECLRAYLELKRAIESSVEDGPAPSAGARARLRAAVAAELGARAPRVAMRVPRPSRLGAAFAGAAAALLAVVALRAALPVVRAPAPAPALPSRQVDTARPPDATIPLL